MERDWRHFRHLLLFFFDQAEQGIDAYHLIKETYLESAPSMPTCYKWFGRFAGGNFDLQLFNLTGKRKVKNEDLKKLLNKNPNLTHAEIARHLNVSRSTITTNLKTMRLNQRIQFDLANHIRCTTCVSLLSRHNKENFLDQVVTGGVMSIFYETLNQKEATTSNKNEIKICIWWDTESVIHYEMLRSNEDAFNSYSHQLYKLKQELDSKQPQLTNNRRKVILLHTSFADINILKSVKEQILEFGWEVLPYPASIVDSAPSYDVFPQLDDTHKYLLLTIFEEVEKRSKIMIPFFDAHLFSRGIYSLPENWEKCIKTKNHCD